MATKVLNTRIINKNDDLTAWESSSVILKKGEIALAAIETATTGNYSVPTYMMKVGDGVSTFSQLKWLAAPAADVYNWAKKASLDVADIPTLSISKISGLQDKLTELENAIGAGGSVGDQIVAAINELDVAASTDADGVVISSISETDGKISVERRALAAADIPALAISKITGLQTALDAKGAKADVEANATAIGEIKTDLAGVKTTANAALPKATYDAFIENVNADAIADAKKAGTDAASALETYKTSNDKALSDEKTARENGDKANAENITAVSGRVTTLENSIKGLTGAMHFVGVSSTDPAGESGATVEGKSSFAAGDVCLFGKKEFVYDGKAWVELGDEGSHLTKDEAASTYVAKTDYNAKVASIEGDISDINTELGKKALASDLTELEGKVTTNTNDISALKTTVGSASSGLVKKANDNATAIEGVSGRVTTIEGDYLKEADKTELEGKISTAKSEAIEEAGSNADLKISTELAKHAGIDKVGTVTSVGVSTTANGGLKVSGSPVTGSGTITVDIDDSVIFEFNCGSSTEVL